ncbi:MAG: 4-(cytidine 5'-diphospho)-2-C-methyl-D-erythritol kinase [Clostridia bacterium]|nr:4-(cytidine 5'-diphospho)-2-C-methyl-D-erythritol kinase [Clostridia bacterium]
MKLTETAYGKINLYLDLTGIRADGYHEICTVMQSVSLCDTMMLEVIPHEEFSVSLICNGADLGCGDDNLIVRAAKRMAARYPNVSGIHRFELEKHIPIAAGMAGGSADAAAVLRLMNRAHELSLSTKELQKIGATIGADVPFCICGGTALCEGIGEKITQFPSPDDFYLAVAIGASSVSTPAAFRALDEKFHGDYSTHTGITMIGDRFKNGESCAKQLYNLFEEVILPADPHAGRIRALLTENHALGALMSGSGPSVFGIFASRDKAQEAVDRLKDLGYRAYLCYTIKKYA